MSSIAELKKVHITLQGKGGVGKSYVASLIAQHQLGLGKELVCVDIDPVNQSLASYEALKVRTIELIENNNVVRRKFDQLLEMLLSEDVDFVVDSGASSFVPLTSYLIENQAIELLSEHKQVVAHTVITGGKALSETLQGFDALASYLPPEAEIIVWLNEFFGPVQSPDGRKFVEMKSFIEHKSRVVGIVKIRKRSSDLFGADLRRMLSLNLTFDEAIKRPDFYVMSKQRLVMIRRGIFEQLNEIK